jgi:hypothetical protein
MVGSPLARTQPCGLRTGRGGPTPPPAWGRPAVPPARSRVVVHKLSRLARIVRERMPDALPLRGRGRRALSPGRGRVGGRRLSTDPCRPPDRCVPGQALPPSPGPGRSGRPRWDPSVPLRHRRRSHRRRPAFPARHLGHRTASADGRMTELDQLSRCLSGDSMSDDRATGRVAQGAPRGAGRSGTPSAPRRAEHGGWGRAGDGAWTRGAHPVTGPARLAGMRAE